MSAAPPPLGPEIRAPLLAGLVGIVVFVLGFGGWMALAPLSRGVVAAGQLVPAGHRRAVQHLEGGIVAAIHARDGTRVAAGDLLLTLQPTRAAADRRALAEAGIRLAAEAGRLRAERDGAAELLFPEPLAAAAAKAGLAAVLADERWRFEQRRAALARERGLLAGRLAHSEAAARTLEAQLAAHEREAAAIGDRHRRTTRLSRNGHSPAFALLDGEARLARVAAELAEAGAALETERRTVDETRSALEAVADRPLLEVGARLAQVEAELAEARERLGKAEDQLARTAIRAPIAGIVLGSTAHTVGGVVAAGATVMELVPSEEPLVAELRVPPTDIDRLQVGAVVRARLLAFPQRHLPPVAGAVVAVSADVVAGADGRPAYLVRARLDPLSLAAAATHLAGPLALAPGMPVQAVIEAGGGTLLGSLVEPLRLSLGRAFKDG